MQMTEQKIPGLDEKQQAIMAAAFEAFRLYGVKRTSMADIASGAGMSRAALYLHYRNKEDIFRSLVTGYYDLATQQVEQVLRQDAPLSESLRNAFLTQAGPVFEALLSSPHGQELLDTKHAHSEDLVIAGEERLAQIYAAWLDRRVGAGDIEAQVIQAVGGDTLSMARTMLSALHGVKTALSGIEEYKVSITRLAHLFGRALAK